MSTNQFPNAEPRSTDIRVVTMNLWGQRGAWSERRRVIRDSLRALRPDLVAFQEAIKSREYDQVIDLLGPEFYIAHQAGREPDGQGISIASRWPLEDVREVDLNVTPRTADFACTTLVAEVLAPSPIRPLLFVNHLPNWQLNFEYERELQAVAAAQFLEKHAGPRSLHVVLAGDFDADPDAASVRFWSGRQSLGGTSVCYRDAWESKHPSDPGHTFTPRNPLVADWDWPFRRIDYIFVRCGDHGGPTLEVSACTRLFDEPVDDVWASDHFGLVADLSLPTHSSTLLKSPRVSSHT
ncbi:MAG: endonuclease/exonuclease/phosphatase family protein [Chloroflexota bacterium]|nr:endonuclease/exonuclease/phosphatase family protein [Chloroflexota bacterium]